MPDDRAIIANAAAGVLQNLIATHVPAFAQRQIPPDTVPKTAQEIADAAIAALAKAHASQS